MKRSSTLAMAFAILALVGGGLGLTTSAWARSPGHGHDRLTRFEEKIDSLGLDDATQQKIHTIIATAQTDQSAIRSQFHEAYQGLRALMVQEPPPADSSLVENQSDNIATLETQYRKKMLDTVLTVLNMLTPEQRVSLREAMRHHGAWKREPGR